VAKITAYKFVNPGVAGASSTPVVRAASQQVLATNRLGSAVEGIGKVVEGLVATNKSTILFQQRQLLEKKKEERRQRDSEAEARQERAKMKSAQQREAAAKKKKDDIDASGELKKQGNGFVSWADKFFGPFVNIFKDIATIYIASNVYSFLSDPANTERIEDFFMKVEFLVKKLKGFFDFHISNIFEGFTALTGKDSTFIERIKGLGQFMFGIIAMKALMNPFGLLTDIFDLMDLAGDLFERRTKQLDAKEKRLNKTKNATKTKTGTTSKPITRAPKKLSPFELEQARKTLTRKNMLAKPGSGLSPKLAPKGAIFGRGVDRVTQRVLLKIIGKGGVKWLTNAFNKIPLIGPLLTFGFNWVAGEPFLKAAAMGVGMGIGQWLGGTAGSAIGALGGPAAPVTVPLGAFVGAMLGGIGGEFLGGYLYDLIAGKANLGKDLGALGGKIKSGLETLWNDYIMNGEFWAGAWQTFLNVGGKIMSDTWQAMTSLWNYATSKVSDFGQMLWEASTEWRVSIWAAFQKYIMTPFADLPDLITKLAKVIADQAVEAWMKSGDFLNKLKDKFVEALKEELDLDFIVEVGKIMINPLLFDPILKLQAIAELLQPALGPVLKWTMDNLQKAGGAFMDALKVPLNEYIDPAVKAVTNSWNLVSNLGKWTYDNGIKPIFDAITGIWNSGPAIWDWLNRPNTFQELTGQEVPPPERAGGGKVSLYAGHADMAINDPSKQFGTHGGVELPGKRPGGDPQQPGGFIPAAKGKFFTNEAYLNYEIAKRAAAKSGGVAVFRSPIRGTSMSDPNSNVSRARADTRRGMTAVEIHQDSPRWFNGRAGTMAGSGRSMHARNKKNSILKAISNAYGVHPGNPDLGFPAPFNSTLLEIGPLDLKYLKSANSYINQHATKLANAIKKGAAGRSGDVNPNEEIDVDDVNGSLGADEGGDYDFDSGMSAVEAGPSIPKNPTEAFNWLYDEMNKLFGAKEAEDVTTEIAFGKGLDLKGISGVDMQTIGNYDFSKAFSMDKAGGEVIPFPVIINMPEPLYTPMPINNLDKGIIFTKESPLLGK